MDNYGGISGVVKNSDGCFIHDAIVKIDGNQVSLNNGYFKQGGITPGTRLVSVEADNYVTVNTNVTVTTGVYSFSTITMTKKTGTIIGYVKNINASGITGVTVTCDNGSTTTSGTFGIFRLLNIPIGKRVLHFSKTGYIMQPDSSLYNIDVLYNSSSNKTFVLNRLPCYVYGKVTDSVSGQAIDNSNYTLSIGSYPVETRSDGLFSRLVPSGSSYTITLTSLTGKYPNYTGTVNATTLGSKVAHNIALTPVSIGEVHRSNYLVYDFGYNTWSRMTDSPTLVDNDPGTSGIWRAASFSIRLNSSREVSKVTMVCNYMLNSYKIKCDNWKNSSTLYYSPSSTLSDYTTDWIPCNILDRETIMTNFNGVNYYQFSFRITPVTARAFLLGSRSGSLYYKYLYYPCEVLINATL